MNKSMFLMGLTLVSAHAASPYPSGSAVPYPFQNATFTLTIKDSNFNPLPLAAGILPPASFSLVQVVPQPGSGIYSTLTVTTTGDDSALVNSMAYFDLEIIDTLADGVTMVTERLDNVPIATAPGIKVTGSGEVLTLPFAVRPPFQYSNRSLATPSPSQGTYTMLLNWTAADFGGVSPVPSPDPAFLTGPTLTITYTDITDAFGRGINVNHDLNATNLGGGNTRTAQSSGRSTSGGPAVKLPDFSFVRCFDGTPWLSAMVGSLLGTSPYDNAYLTLTAGSLNDLSFRYISVDQWSLDLDQSNGAGAANETCLFSYTNKYVAPVL